MADPGLRERKKRRTRELIAAAAARLFAERGYESVSILDIAAVAEVSEQTVYNHFPTKPDLVLDRDRQLRDDLTNAIARRARDVSPAAAIRDVALSLVDGLHAMDVDAARGGLGYLSTRSPAVRGLSLQMTDRHADAIAAVLTAEPDGPPPATAKIHAIALAWVIQTITDFTGQRTEAGQRPPQIAVELRPIVNSIIDDLDTWPARPRAHASAPRRARDRRDGAGA